MSIKNKDILHETWQCLKPLVFGFAGIGILLLLSFTPIAADRACALAQALEPKGACLDFWLNRYQTLIAGLLAVLATLAAGAIAWRAAQRQINSARAEAAAQRLATYADLLEQIEGAWLEAGAPGADDSKRERFRKLRYGAPTLAFTYEPTLGPDCAHLLRMLMLMTHDIQDAEAGKPPRPEMVKLFSIAAALRTTVAERCQWLKSGGAVEALFNRADIDTREFRDLERILEDNLRQREYRFFQGATLKAPTLASAPQSPRTMKEASEGQER